MAYGDLRDRYDGDKLDDTVREIQSIGSGFFPSFQALGQKKDIPQ